MPHTDPSTAARRIDLLQRYFLTRTDRLASLAPWGQPCPIAPGDMLEAVLEAHVIGTRVPAVHLLGDGREKIEPVTRIGSYTPDAAGLTRWICIDYDGPGHSHALADPWAALTSSARRASDFALPVYLERSGSGKGWHLWAFFAEPVPAGAARRLGIEIAGEAPLANGGVSSARANRGLEVFPKAESARIGSMVWLPWWHAARRDVPANEIHRPGTDGPTPYLPDDLEPITADQLEAALASLAPEPDPEPAPARTSKPAPSSALEWDRWRLDALAALDLDRIYGDALTGKRDSKGWLEARDPSSPSGDRDPSASVADGTGDAVRGTWHSHRTGETLSVFDYLQRHGGASSFMEAARRVAEASGVQLPPPRRRLQPVPSPAPMDARAVLAEARAGAPRDEPPDEAPPPPEEPPPPPRDEPPPPPPGGKQRPRILINDRQLRDVIADSWRALIAANTPPKVFRRFGALARVDRDAGGARLELLSRAQVYGLTLRVADWVKVRRVKGEDYFTDANPPKEVADDLAAYPRPEIPELLGVTEAPAVSPSGRFVTAPGYDAETRIWYEPHGRPVEPPPAKPNLDEHDAAWRLLCDDVLGDFRFAADADRAHAVAAMLLPLVRPMIDGPTPIHLIEAPAPGSGKSLLADVISIVATGRPVEPTTIDDDEAETRKKLTALLISGRPVIVLDNVRWGSKSDQLASAITATTWTDRVLGRSEMVSPQNRATWLITANNPRLSIDLARRCVRIRIEPRTAKPWERSGWRHDPIPLRTWVTERRPAILRALLTLAAVWLSSGRPLLERTLGSFEAWASTVPPILERSGICGALTGLDQLYEEADSETGEWLAFAAAWWDRHRDTWVEASVLLDMANAGEHLAAVLGDRGPRSQATRLAHGLLRLRGRVLDGRHVETEIESHAKRRLYRLRPLLPDGVKSCAETGR